MRPEQQLFTVALGLEKPWEVRDINFEAESSRLDIKIDFDRASLFPCPECGKLCNLKDSKEKTWRHLNFFQHECYAIDTTPQTVLVGNDSKTYKISFVNYPEGTLVINKYDSKTKEPLAGAEFKVTTSSGNVVGNANGIYTTDTKGTIIIPSLLKGSYIVTETKAPEGYTLSNQTQTVVIDYSKTYSLDFYNVKKSGVQIVKIDSATKQPLKGAKFKVYKQNGELVGEYETDGDGLIIIDPLDNGWYKAVEVKSPDGFLLDDTPKDFEIKGNQFLKLTFENKKLSGIVIKKIDDKSGIPLAGAKFTITKQNGEHVGDYETDSSGSVVVPTLQPDWYVVKETKSPDGYVLKCYALEWIFLIARYERFVLPFDFFF